MFANNHGGLFFVKSILGGFFCKLICHIVVVVRPTNLPKIGKYNIYKNSVFNGQKSLKSSIIKLCYWV